MPTVRGGDGKDYPASAFLYVPDRSKPSTWKIRYKEYVGGALKVTKKILGMAAAAVGPGFRGQKASLPSGVMASIRKKLVSLYRSIGVDKKLVPPHLMREQTETPIEPDLLSVVEHCELLDNFEETLASGKVTIDLDAGVIKNAPMIGLVSKNKGRKGKQRRYSEAGMRRAFEEGKYEGAASYLNHPDRREAPKVENLIGNWKNTYWDNETHIGRGDLYIRDKAAIKEEVLSLAKDCPSLAGPSHRADGTARFVKDNGKEWDEIYFIDSVQSVDLVAGPATVKSFTEAAELSDKQGESNMSKNITDNDYTVEDFKNDRPDLYTLIKEDNSTDNSGFEALYETIRQEKAALESQLKDMEREKTNLEELYKYKETLKVKLQESALPKAAQDRVFELFGGQVMTEEKIAEVVEMETKYLEEATGKKLSKAKVDAPAEVRDTEGEVSLKEAFRKKLGLNKKED